MEPLIPDTTTDARMSGLERFLEHYLGPRRPEYGAPEEALQRIEMPDPLRRFFRFAGRWPGHGSIAPYDNRFYVPDQLCNLAPNQHAAVLQVLDGRLFFVVADQGVWFAATEPCGVDPPVWITEDVPTAKPIKSWRSLEHPLSHFLVSFALQGLVFSSSGSLAQGALEKFEQAGLAIHPVWLRGEYAWDIDRPSYFLIDDRILLRRALDEASGDDWYGFNHTDAVQTLKSLGLPTSVI